MKNLLFLLLLLSLPAGAQTAASCSASDVQALFNGVSTSTTTLNIPACAGTGWATQVTLNIPSGNPNHISLLCAGSLTTPGGGDATIIKDNVTANENPILVIQDAVTNGYFRMAGCSFEDGTGAGQPKFNGVVQINASSPNIRVDHSHFVTSSSGSSSIQWQGCAYGVIDHSIFDGGGVANAVRAYNSGTCNGDSLGVGDQSWTLAPGFGGPNFLFMENNTFNSGASDDCTDGGKFVARFNTYNTTTPAPTIQTHPTGGAGRIRGCRAQEVYENSMLPQPSNYIDTDIWISSGSARVWGNTTTSSSTGGGTGYDAFIKWIEMRQNNNTYSQSTPPDGWGYCGTGQTGTASNWDSNTGGASGYFCLDGPGAGQGDLLTGGFTIDGSGSNNVTNNATGCTSSLACAWPRQANEKLYAWMNSFSPTPSNPTTFFAAQYSGSSNNVDYYLDCRAGSASGCTTFTGATGVGDGILSARPTNCTTGVAYWATDQGSWNTSGSGPQGELFTCVSTNTWSSSPTYVPYTYPHPLVTGGTTPTATLTTAGNFTIKGTIILK